MIVLHDLLSVLVSVAGGVVVATAVGFLFWNLMKVVRHPEYGPCAGVAALIGLLAIGVRADQVLGMGVLFLLIAAVVLWPAGSEWRNRRSRRGAERNASRSLRGRN